MPMLRRLVLVCAIAGGMLAVAGAAGASCAFDDRPLDQQVAEADLVFVGTVADVRHATTALFEVEEVWKGDVPARVTVLGGPDEPGAATSVDRSWQPGARYLVVPRVADGEVRDDSCSPTREWTDDLDAARPATAHAPLSAPPEEGVSDATVMGWAAAVLLAAVVGSAVLIRPRREESEEPREG